MKKVYRIKIISCKGQGLEFKFHDARIILTTKSHKDIIGKGCYKSISLINFEFSHFQKDSYPNGFNLGLKT